MVNDVDPNVLRPTGANVKMMLDWLCSNRKPTDSTPSIPFSERLIRACTYESHC
jgi:hypothetical protein